MSTKDWLKRKYWNIRGMMGSGMSVFEGHAADLNKKDFPDPISKIFFANKGPTVHKWLHYLPIYQKHFGPYVGTKVRFLEIGVFKGGSLKMWRDFLGPQAVIYGIDINPACAAYDGQHGQVRIGSQADPAFLAKVVAEMGGVDVILDDGSHVATHQRVSFDTLFPLLSENGIYMIEDLHTAYWAEFEGGLRRKGTGIEFLKKKIDDMHKHYLIGSGVDRFAMGDIESIAFYDSIAVLHKRQQVKRQHVKVPPLQV